MNNKCLRAFGVFCTLMVGIAFNIFAQNTTVSSKYLPAGNFGGDTLFPQISVIPDSFFIVIKPDTVLKKELVIFNSGDDTLFYSIDTEPEPWPDAVGGFENIEESTLTFSSYGYKPGQALDFSLNLYNGSVDNEWLDTLIVKFPEGVNLNFATNFIGGTQGSLVFDGTIGNAVRASWNDENTTPGGNILPGETATAIANLSFDAALHDTLQIIYEIRGDNFGGEPHIVVDTLLLFPEEIWLIAQPDTGFALPGGQTLISLNFNSAGLAIGNYSRYFNIHSNDTTTPLYRVPVNMIVFPYTLTQYINVPVGWSGISAYVIPGSPEFETIFDTVNEYLDVIYNSQTQLYWPDEVINTIGNWDTFDGYIVKANEPFQIRVYGMFEISQTVLLNEGWNILPVLSSVPASSFVVFRDIDQYIDIVQEIGGSKIYWPEQSIYTLTQLLPGKAYFIRVKENCSVVFPLPVD